jgi:hypothetical protein
MIARALARSEVVSVGSSLRQRNDLIEPFFNAANRFISQKEKNALFNLGFLVASVASVSLTKSLIGQNLLFEHFEDQSEKTVPGQVLALALNRMKKEIVPTTMVSSKNPEAFLDVAFVMQSASGSQIESGPMVPESISTVGVATVIDIRTRKTTERT